MEGKREKENNTSCIKCTLINVGSYVTNVHRDMNHAGSLESTKDDHFPSASIVQFNCSKHLKLMVVFASLETEMTYEPIVF